MESELPMLTGADADVIERGREGPYSIDDGAGFGLEVVAERCDEPRGGVCVRDVPLFAPWEPSMTLSFRLGVPPAVGELSLWPMIKSTRDQPESGRVPCAWND